MNRILSISSPTDPRISFFHLLKGNAPRLEEAQVVLVEGDQQVERLLRSPLHVTSLFMEERYYERFWELIQTRVAPDTPLYCANREVMEAIVGYRLHQGVMATARRPDYVPLEQIAFPAAALCGIADPENVGSIVRNAVAFGIRSLLVDRGTCDPYHRRALRVSMGGALSMSVAETPDLVSAITRLAASCTPVAVELAPGALPLPEWLPPEKPLLVFGSERHGIPEPVLRACHSVVKVPMDASIVSSLNVNATSALIFSAIFQSAHR